MLNSDVFRNRTRWYGRHLLCIGLRHELCALNRICFVQLLNLLIELSLAFYFTEDAFFEIIDILGIPPALTSIVNLHFLVSKRPVNVQRLLPTEVTSLQQGLVSRGILLQYWVHFLSLMIMASLDFA